MLTLVLCASLIFFVIWHVSGAAREGEGGSSEPARHVSGAGRPRVSSSGPWTGRGVLGAECDHGRGGERGLAGCQEEMRSHQVGGGDEGNGGGSAGWVKKSGGRVLRKADPRDWGRWAWHRHHRKSPLPPKEPLAILSLPPPPKSLEPRTSGLEGTRDRSWGAFSDGGGVFGAVFGGPRGLKVGPGRWGGLRWVARGGLGKRPPAEWGGGGDGGQRSKEWGRYVGQQPACHKTAFRFLQRGDLGLHWASVPVRWTEMWGGTDGDFFGGEQGEV